jgi:hypothetical protein
MANKKTIQQLEADIDRYMRRLNYCARKITENRELIKRIRKGQVKQPPPPGIKVKLHAGKAFDDDLSDVGSGYGCSLGDAG